MEHRIGVRKPLLGLLAALGVVMLMSGCATKKYVRTEVGTSAEELSAKIETTEQTLKATQEATQQQVVELSGVTSEHSQKIDTLDSGLKQTDSKAQQALTTGQTAQNTATKVAGEVASLDNKFQNRNNYIVLNEEQVRFKFDSAKLDPAFESVLDEVAQQLKQSPDTILVIEGRTDASGSDDYNVRLGQQRAEAVIRHLVVKNDVPINRISEVSFGKDRPLADNKTRDGRAQNRSVVIRVMGPQLDKAGTVSLARPDETE